MQDLILRTHVIRYRRERWLTPGGSSMMAPMPVGLCGHFGPGLRRFVLAQHDQGQVTTPRLLEQLRRLGWPSPSASWSACSTPAKTAS